MPSYKYRALDATGTEKKGVIDGANEKLVNSRLREMGLRPFEIAEIKQTTKEGISIPFLGRKRVKSDDLMQFTRQLATLIDAGLPLLRGLTILEEQSENPAMKEVVAQIKTDVQGGASFSDALTKHPNVFSKLYVSMIKAGEVGGVLEVVLDRLAEFAEKEQKLRAKVKSAMIYPIVLIVVASAVVSLLMIFVVPQFESMFAEMGVQLPLITRIMITISRFMKNWWYILMIGIAVGVYGIQIWARSTAGKEILDTYKLKLPLFGELIRKFITARFTRTLGTLLQSGVPILQALSITKDVANNVVMERAIENVSVAITEGSGMAEPLHRSGVFAPMVTNMIAVGEETGALDQMLNKIADNYEMIVDEAVSGLTSMLEPLLIVFMGAAVGSVVASLFLPLFSIAEAIH
ncbi:MAG: type II secretion system inner membrane protein GspF [Candidatus Hydrogenedentota bacterium]